MRFPAWTIGCILTGAFMVASGQSLISLHISQVMTPAELSATGVNSLSQPQRAALDAWLNTYTGRAFAAARKTNAQTSDTSYIGGKHWIDEVCKDGAIVILEDDSMWEIESVDRVDTSLWLSTTDISVSKPSRAEESYPYLLRNTEDKEVAHAKYLGTL